MIYIIFFLIFFLFFFFSFFRTGDLLLTSGMYRPPFSCLWTVGDFFDMKYAFEEEEYVEFSKTVQDKIVGTKGETATVYDVNTGKKIMSLSPSTSNNYTKNRATFHPSDELILSDGVLWDAISGNFFLHFYLLCYAQIYRTLSKKRSGINVQLKKKSQKNWINLINRVPYSIYYVTLKFTEL